MCEVYSLILGLSSMPRKVNGRREDRITGRPGDVPERATMRPGDICLKQFIGARGECPVATTSYNKTPL